MTRAPNDRAGATALPHLPAIAIELARRAAERVGHPSEYSVVPYVIRVSKPLTALEKLQLKVAILLRSPIALVPHHCKTVDEWVARYGKIANRRGPDQAAS